MVLAEAKRDTRMRTRTKSHVQARSTALKLHPDSHIHHPVAWLTDAGIPFYCENYQKDFLYKLKFARHLASSSHKRLPESLTVTR